MPKNRFTNRKVAQLHGKSLYGLGNNLYVREKSGARKYFVFIYRQRIGNDRGKKVEMTFGPTAKLDIRDAEEWAQQQNALIAKGIDPRTHKIVEHQAAEKAARARKTFGQVAKEYIEGKTDPTDPKRWGDDCTKQMKQIRDRILETPLGKLLVTDPDAIQLAGADVLNSVAKEAPVMALRFRDLMFGAMDLARRQRCYQGANPFATDGDINQLAPIRHSSKPHPGWHHRELPRLYKLLCAAETDCGHDGLWTTAQAAKATGRERYVILNDIRYGRIPPVERANIGKTSTYLLNPADVKKRYEIKNPNPEPNFGVEHLAIPLLRFLLLTAVRFSEANELPWDEINWSNRTWTIPAERTKKKIEHVVPLSPPAYEILGRQQARGLDNRCVFVHGPSLTGSDYHVGEPLTDPCVRRHLRKATGDPFITIHSFRRNCRSWAKDRGYPLEIRRMILGHAVGNKVDGTYEADANCVEQCRRLLEDWANYLAGSPKSAKTRATLPKGSIDNIVSISERRARNA
jgi:integrase